MPQTAAASALLPVRTAHPYPPCRPWYPSSQHLWPLSHQRALTGGESGGRGSPAWCQSSATFVSTASDRLAGMARIATADPTCARTRLVLMCPAVALLLGTLLLSSARAATTGDVFVSYSAEGVPSYASQRLDASYRLFIRGETVPEGRSKASRKATGDTPQAGKAQLAPLIEHYARLHDVTPALVAAVVSVESDARRFRARPLPQPGTAGRPADTRLAGRARGACRRAAGAHRRPQRAGRAHPGTLGGRGRHRAQRGAAAGPARPVPAAQGRREPVQAGAARRHQRRRTPAGGPGGTGARTGRAARDQLLRAVLGRPHAGLRHLGRRLGERLAAPDGHRQRQGLACADPARAPALAELEPRQPLPGVQPAA
jgi:hypothetical protein